jgi:hypothetical protein
MTPNPGEATSHDGLTREQALVKGEHLDTYRYPFSKEATDYSRMPNAPWEDSLPETNREPDGIYRKDGFDFKEAVSHVPGPIVEVGGPTINGYEFLHGTDLPDAPRMLNMRGSRVEAIGSASLTAVDSLALTALADVRALPVANESLGMMMCSNLPGAPEAMLRNIAFDPNIKQGPEQTAHIMAETDRLYNDAADTLQEGEDKALESHESPRIAAVAQARRTLKPGGLFLMHGLESRDVALAKALGLELVMHTPRAQWEWGGLPFETIDEAVFQKPAG